jgi:hypothetical protein
MVGQRALPLADFRLRSKHQVRTSRVEPYDGASPPDACCARQEGLWWAKETREIMDIEAMLTKLAENQLALDQAITDLTQAVSRFVNSSRSNTGTDEHPPE